MRLDLKRSILIMMLFILSGCTDSFCIDADDFGYPVVNVPAHYNSDQIHGAPLSQYADWIDSGLVLNGSSIHMTVKGWNYLKNVNNKGELSAWCPWLGPSANPPSLQQVCIFFDKCVFQNNDSCSAQANGDADILNAPCLMHGGMGLYVLVAPNGYNPNLSQQDNITPQQGKVFHLGDPMNGNYKGIPYYDLLIDPFNNNSTYIPTGGMNLLFDDTGGDALRYNNGKLYYKILDKYYNDNSGQYIVNVKTGVTKHDWDPMAFIPDMVYTFFFGTSAHPAGMVNGVVVDSNGTIDIDNTGVIRVLFNGVVTSKGYKLTVSALLTLAILFYSINFLMGNIQMTHHDLLFRVIKILIVSQLISGDSWNFFYNNLFVYTLQGSKYLMKIISDAGGSGAGSNNIIAFMLAPHTLIKLLSLPLISWTTFGWSILYIGVYIGSLMLILMGMLYAAIAQVTCLLMLGLVITLAPIFLCFMLFESTKTIFDTWLKELVAYALQPIIIIAGLTLMSLLIRHQIYQTLGFRVCKNYYLSMAQENALSSVSGDEGRGAVGLFYWMPDFSTGCPPGTTGSACGKLEQQVEMLIPEAHYRDAATGEQVTMGSYLNITNSGKTYQFCEQYQCTGKRYPSFPYLNPNDNLDMKMLRSFWDGNFAPIGNLLMLLLCGFLLVRFNSQAMKIGQYITGGSMDLSKTVGAATNDTAQAGMAVASGAVKAAAKIAQSAGKMAGGMLKGGKKRPGGDKKMGAKGAGGGGKAGGGAEPSKVGDKAAASGKSSSLGKMSNKSKSGGGGSAPLTAGSNPGGYDPSGTSAQPEVGKGPGGYNINNN